MTNDSLYSVYKHTAPNGKVYIGITKNDPKVRWHGGNGYARNEHFYKAIKKYGWDNITHEVIETGLSCEAACEEEQRLIAEYNSANPKCGYNGTYGGEHYKPTQETIEKVRQAHRVYKSGSDNPTAKPILQYDKDGNLVKRWGSIADAAKEYCKTCIKDCLKGKYKVGCGFVWKYENEVKNNAVLTE